MPRDDQFRYRALINCSFIRIEAPSAARALADKRTSTDRRLKRGKSQSGAARRRQVFSARNQTTKLSLSFDCDKANSTAADRQMHFT